MHRFSMILATNVSRDGKNYRPNIKMQASLTECQSKEIKHIKYGNESRNNNNNTCRVVRNFLQIDDFATV